MRGQEVNCFQRALDCHEDQITVCDVLTERPGARTLRQTDGVFIGGSGNYSATQTGLWLDRTFDLLRELVAISKPTFASCWGFQAMARALGGRVVTDLRRAELGTLPLRLTPAGRQDPLFGELPTDFHGPLGHEDIVTELPEEAICLASSQTVQNQAFVIRGKPIYGTQFHPELNRRALLQRVEAYPQYVERILGIHSDQFAKICVETPDTNQLMQRFVARVFSE